MDEKGLTREELIAETDSLRKRIAELERDNAEIGKDVEQYSRLVENLPCVIMRISLPDGRFEYVSRSSLMLTGYSPEEIIGHPLSIRQFIHPDSIESFNREWERLLTGRAKPSYEYKIVNKAGRTGWMQQINIVARDEAGNPSFLEGILFDVTERKRAQEDSRRSRRFLSNLVEHSGAIICVKDRDGRYELVNRKWEEVTGLDRKTVIGRTDADLFPEPVAEQFRGHDLEVMETGAVLEKEEYLAVPQGKRFFIAVKFPLRGDGGAISGICAMITEITARKKAEEELSVSEERLARAEVISHSGNWEFDMQSKRVFASEGARRIYGLPDRDWTIPDVQKLVLSEYRPMLDRALTDLIAGKQPYDVEFEIRRPDTGQIVDIQSVAEYDPERGVVFGVIRDITEPKRAEAQRATALEALAKSESMMRAITDSAQDAILMMDPAGAISFWNPAAEQIFGYSRREAMGRNLHHFLAPGRFLDMYQAAFERFKTNGRGLAVDKTLELRACRKNGEEFPIELSLSAIQLEDGWHAVGIIRDVTERKKAEEMSRQAEEKFYKVFMTTPDCIAITRLADGLLLDANKGYEEVLGWKREDVIGLKSANPRVNFWVDPAARDDMVAELAAGREVMHREFQFRRKDRAVRTGVYSARSIHIAGESCVIFILHDVTEQRRLEEERKKLEQQLFQSQKMEAIGNLAGGIAHDFNNILAGIIGYADLYKDAVRDRPKVHHGIEQVLQAANRAKDLVTQILTFSRKTDREKIPIALAPIVKEVVKFMRASLPTTIEIKHKIEAASGAVMADPTQMHQVLMNLCTNAGQAMKDTGGLLTVGLREIPAEEAHLIRQLSLKPGRYLELSIRDTGRGISPEDQERIFEPYFTTKEKGKGTGLGLAVVHGIVKDQGGDIRVYSEEGRGTVFRIYLPAIEKKLHKEVKTADAVPHGRGEKILFVDDEPMVAELGKEMLQEIGYTVTALTDPVLAVESFRKKRGAFDLVITDKTMPHMTGFDVVREIRNIRPDIPVIVCSGFQEKGDLDKIAALGVRRMIIKPAAMDVMANAIRDALDQKDTA